LRAGAATALATPALAAPALAQSAPEIKWRLTSSFSKNMEIIHATAQTLCRCIAEASDNKFLVQLYQAGELAPSRQALDAVSSGSVDCAYTPTNFYVAKDPTLAFGTGVPFGLSSRQQQAWWTFGGGADIVNTSLKRLNVIGIPAGLTGAQMGAWLKKEIASVEDLKGLRWRIAGLGGPVLARIGVAPQDRRRRSSTTTPAGGKAAG
jgi:TRAP-type mannitol/chloroaromatic compound transport system substrate-binding protein